jgi:hypothetical protein
VIRLGQSAARRGADARSIATGARSRSRAIHSFRDSRELSQRSAAALSRSPDFAGSSPPRAGDGNSALGTPVAPAASAPSTRLSGLEAAAVLLVSKTKYNGWHERFPSDID